MNPLTISNNFRHSLKLHVKYSYHKQWITLRMFSSSFKFHDLQINRIKNENVEKILESKIQFGNLFTNHMLEIRWTKSNGWGKPVISPFQNFSMHPASKVLHYAQTLFEGLKAYRCVDGKIRLFRPDMNMNRMLESAVRASLPEFDKEELLKCIKELIKIDEEWIPSKPMHSLYIRPTFIGIEPTLGVASSNECLLFVIMSPVGSYFHDGIEPVGLYTDVNAVRSWPGGVGDKKMGANYAATIKIHKNALKKGCQQVLWLYGQDHQLTEIGTMNIFVLLKNENNEVELVTPPLEDGLILPGITRNSILTLAREWNDFKVVERKINMKEILKAIQEKRILEIFGAGTACIVLPVNKILYMDKTIVIPHSEKSLNRKILNAMTSIYYGKVKHKWSVDVD